MNTKSAALVGTMAVALLCHPASAAIIFDDFNLDEGHFNSDPNTSATSVGDDPASVADLVIGGSFEGAGHQLLRLIHDASTTPYRVRHLSGGGTPANNISFSITDGVDGYIGFWARTTATGWQTSINLDGPTGSTADMDGSTSIPLIADGEWHLYEWNLDATDIWGVVPGIGGGHGGALVNGTHTIDSIYFRDLDGSPGPDADIEIDFVAKSDSGSIGALVPEPSAALAALAGGVALLSRTRRRH